jgi:release factor glutamine methyltransferase
VLVPSGRLLMEIGPGQGQAVAALCRTAGLQAVTVLQDIDGRDRVVSAIAASGGL